MKIKYPHVIGELDTLERALVSSVGRYGDGELRLALGSDCISQVAHPGLRWELVSLLKNPGGACLPCIPNFESDTPKVENWRKYAHPAYTALYTYKGVYGSAFITRPDSAPWIDTPAYWGRVRDLWRGRDVTLVAGTDRSLRLDMMTEASRVRVVVGPRRDAYKDIDKIEEEIGKPSGPIILCIGATATVLAARLARKGLHAVDLGHIGMFMRKEGAFAMEKRELISDEYLRQNILLHRAPEGFGGSGWKQAQNVLAFAGELKATSILDYGCGEGTLRKELIKLGYTGNIFEYDPAVKGKDILPKMAELVVCTDVFEHVEPDRLPAVLNHFEKTAIKGAYVVIATRLANKTLPDGRNAHLIVQPYEWWLPKFEGWKILRQDGKPSHDLKLWLVK